MHEFYLVVPSDRQPERASLVAITGYARASAAQCPCELTRFGTVQTCELEKVDEKARTDEREEEEAEQTGPQQELHPVGLRRWFLDST
eukprot:1397178-Rhodomonas_salina.1